MKVCSRCHLNKPLSDFYKDPRYRLGVHGWCKACQSDCEKASRAKRKLLPKPVVFRKTCSTCNTEKPITEFSRCPDKRDGHAARCKACRLEREAVRRMLTDNNVTRDLKRRFGMTYDDIRQMLDKQEHACAICAEPLDRPMIDHDHSTLAVRGLLCAWCNTRLATLEDAAFVKRATAYLDQHRGRLPRFFANKRHWELQRAVRAKRKQTRREMAIPYH